MYSITKRMVISAAHSLDMGDPDHKCSNKHGHNWIITVQIEAEQLNRYGMVIDFGFIKYIVMELDHIDLNTVVSVNGVVLGNPTAENIARYLTEKIDNEISSTWFIEEHMNGEKAESMPHVKSVTVEESEGNTACYTP